MTYSLSATIPPAISTRAVGIGALVDQLFITGSYTSSRPVATLLLLVPPTTRSLPAVTPTTGWKCTAGAARRVDQELATGSYLCSNPAGTCVPVLDRVQPLKT